MRTHASWWANRKSRIGVSPAAKIPPHLPGGKPWWSSQPVAAPQPEHIEYAVAFMMELMRMPPNKEVDVMRQHVGAWLKAARGMLHEHVEADHGELHTTDGLIIATARAFKAAMSRIHHLGGASDERWYQISQALEARSHEARRRRANGRVTGKNGAE